MPSSLDCIDARTSQPLESRLSHFAFDDPSQTDSSPADLSTPTLVLPSSNSTNNIFNSFAAVPIVIELLKNIKENCFTPDHLCKMSCSILRSLKPHPSISLSPSKPFALHVKEMIDPTNFNHGSNLIPSEKLKIKPDTFLKYHTKYCHECKTKSQLSSTCYFNYLYSVLRYGWTPPLLDFNLPYPKYKASSYTPSHKFFDISQSLINKYIANKTIHSFEVNPLEEFNTINTPINVVIKKSESYRASLYSDILLNSSKNIDRVNSILSSLNLDIIAPRPVFDFNCTGLNSILYSVRFSNSSIMDIIKFVKPCSYMYIFDIESFYPTFAYAEEFKSFNTFKFENTWYVGDFILFGISSAPAFCATFTAEILFYISEENINASAMTDDFNLIDDSKELVTTKAESIITMIEDIGFSIKSSKTKIGKCLTYLGVLINTEDMCISFDSIKSKSFIKTLNTFIDNLLSSPLKIKTSTVNSIAGKLNDFSKVILGGRLHIRHSWKLIYDYLIPNIIPSNHFINLLISDINWWISKLSTWASGNLTGNEYPILNYHSLAASNKLIVIQSDASGPDGHGLIYGSLHTLDPMFFAETWRKNFTAEFSHQFELASIREFFHVKKDSLGLNCLYIWLSDAAGSVWSINKGYCSSQESFIVLSDILESLETKKSNIVGFWIPREENPISDYFSHYAKFCNVDRVEGFLSSVSAIKNLKTKSLNSSTSFPLTSSSSSLPTVKFKSELNSNFYLPNNNLRIREGLAKCKFNKPPNRISTFNISNESNSKKLCSILLQDGRSSIPSSTHINTIIPFKLYVKKQWIYKINFLRSFKTEKSLHSIGHSLAFEFQSQKTNYLDQQSEISRLDSFKSERCSNNETLISNVKTSFGRYSGGFENRCSFMAGPRWSASIGGYNFRTPCIGYYLVSKSSRLRTKSGSYQNSQKRGSDINSISISTGPLCSKKNAKVLRFG